MGHHFGAMWMSNPVALPKVLTPLGQTMGKCIIFIILHGKALSYVNLVITACRRLIIVFSQFPESISLFFAKKFQASLLHQFRQKC